jgi:probable DNA metabolism protein
MHVLSHLKYDGSLEGFLTCIYTCFDQKLKVSAIQVDDNSQQEFFATTELINTDPLKAKRVKDGLLKKLSPSGYSKLYFAFLSELPNIEMQLLQYIKMAFFDPNFNKNDFGHPVILHISKVAKMVSREKHRMEAFIRFRLTKDDIYFAGIEPDFNVLPLILKHFESRYADQDWIIFDLKRNYGLHYNQQNTNYISLDLSKEFDFQNSDPAIFAASEVEFQKLWQEYFKSTNIKSRKNMKLHIQHVPKRYWKYLTEKSSLLN